MAVLSLGEVPELQKLIGPYGYKLHVHDACGGQSFSLEITGGAADERVYGVIDSFFAAHGMKTDYYDREKLNFIAG